MKTIHDQAKDYLNDPRWKQATALCNKLQFAEAVTLLNQIINSYPADVRQAAADVE